MLRLAGVVDLVGSSVVVTYVSAAVVIGCNGGDLASPGSHAGDGGAKVSIPGVTGLVAGNGVPIPDPPLPDPCAALDVAVMRCGPTDACPALTCTCGVVQQTIEVAGSCGRFGACLTGISCPAACAHSDLLSAGALSDCVQAGVCVTDADCTNPARPRCLVALDGTSGHCVDGQVDSECYRDADCAASVCVAFDQGPRVCVDNQMGGPCNRDDQCPAPASGTGRSQCVLPAGDFVGRCSDGTTGSACVTVYDCLPGYACAQLLGDSLGTCTSRAQGAPCAVNGDCAQGRCVDVGDPNTGGTLGVCDTGDLGTRCLKPSDCLSGFCSGAPADSPGGAVCTDGADGAPCIIDADCATQLCASRGAGGPLGQCTDGMQGSPCWGPNSTQSQCEAGLVCQGGGAAGTCITAGSVGAPCQQDSDCLAQKCALAALPAPGLAVCTEGKRGQRCQDSSQCDAGLHCVSSGTFSVCVAGAPGDPCRVAGDCASGTCLSMSGATASCTGVADLASCGVMGSCVAGVCLPVCM